MNDAPGVYVSFGNDLLGPWESLSPDVQQAWRNLQSEIDTSSLPGNHWRNPMTDINDRKEHVFLAGHVIASDEPQSREAAELALHKALNDGRDGLVHESWWIAEDERNDGSDLDSAVFVKPGKQQEAVALLREHGLAY